MNSFGKKYRPLPAAAGLLITLILLAASGCALITGSNAHTLPSDANLSRMTAEMSSLRAAIDQYHDQHGVYPLPADVSTQGRLGSTLNPWPENPYAAGPLSPAPLMMVSRLDPVAIINPAVRNDDIRLLLKDGIPPRQVDDLMKRIQASPSALLVRRSGDKSAYPVDYPDSGTGKAYVGIVLDDPYQAAAVAQKFQGDPAVDTTSRNDGVEFPRDMGANVRGSGDNELQGTYFYSVSADRFSYKLTGYGNQSQPLYRAP